MGWSGRAPVATSNRMLGRAPETRSTLRLRHSTLQFPWLASISARTRSILSATMSVVLSCWRQKWSRGQVEARLANMPPCLVGMEACVGAHHLTRKLKAVGHDARLMPAKYVRPYSKGQRNDFRDAEAIAEAVQRPTMKFVATKTADQLDLQALHRGRERWSASAPALSIRSAPFCCGANRVACRGHNRDARCHLLRHQCRHGVWVRRPGDTQVQKSRRPDATGGIAACIELIQRVPVLKYCEPMQVSAGGMLLEPIENPNVFGYSLIGSLISLRRSFTWLT
jgi:hypothetical protein